MCEMRWCVPCCTPTDSTKLRNNLEEEDVGQCIQEDPSRNFRVGQEEEPVNERTGISETGGYGSSSSTAYETGTLRTKVVRRPPNNRSKDLSVDSESEIEMSREDYRSQFLDKTIAASTDDDVVRFPRHRRVAVASYPIVTGYYRYPNWNKHERWTLQLEEWLVNSDVFGHLNRNEVRLLVAAMSTHLFYPDEVIVQQGERGDGFYCVLEGKVDFFVGHGKERRKVESYGAGEMLDQTAVLWGLQRANTWVATEPCVLAKLAHKDYMCITVRIDFYRRERRQAMLREVKLLEMMEDEEISKIADCLKVKIYPAGAQIITFGEQGRHFFILESGEARVWVKNDKGGETEYCRYKKGALFGELALLKNAPRAANVSAVTRVETLVLSRTQFERLFGLMSDMLAGQFLSDPRKLCAEFYSKSDRRGPAGTLKLKGLEPEPGKHGESLWFCVYRPCSNDAIAKMLGGRAVGKGLNIKGKSAKQGKLSGFVPFLQISDNKHKALVEQSPPGARLAIYYRKKHARDDAKKALDSIMATNNSLQIKEKVINLLADYDTGKDPKMDVYGLDIPEPLLREAYIMMPDLSPVMGWETGRRSEPFSMDMNLHGIRDASEPKVVLYQIDESDCMNPRGLLVAYAEKLVKPVVSDFDTFTVASKGVTYEPLPMEQAELMIWELTHTEAIISTPDHRDWTSRWIEILKKENERGFHPQLPKYGFGDPTSYAWIGDIVQTTAACGAVRHGAECFNLTFPQELDPEFLIVWEGFEGTPWQYKDEAGLRAFLTDRAKEGFCFPINPCWPVRNKGWMDLLNEMLKNANTAQVLQSWYLPQLQILEKVKALHEALPEGFIQRAES